MAGVAALGLNGFYQDGGLGWAHRVADQVEQTSTVAWAMYSSRADEFAADLREESERPMTASSSMATGPASVDP